MKNRLILTVVIAGGCLFGCSGSSNETTEAPKGKMPESVNATPGMKSPEERAAERVGGASEGS